jgi:hypothetical protein
MCRETYTDRSTQAEMTCNITLLSDIDATQPITIEQALQRSISTQQFFTNTSKTFLGLSKLMAEHVNVLPVVSPDLMKAMGGDPNYLYYWASFIVQPDEALTIHVPTVSECENWGLCLYNHWLESLDHTRSQINLNKFTAKQNDDESMTIIVSDQAPPGGNWLDTQKHTRGNMMFRWTRVKDVVHPKTKLVKLNEANWNALLKRWPG